MQIPAKGMGKQTLMSALDAARARDANWRDGKTFSLVYYAGDDVLELLHDAFMKFFSENALNPMAFPSLKKFESDVVSMAGNLLSHPSVAGSMTSGGTESILMAVKTARDWAREHRPHATAPEMVLPITVHPAFEKAAHYFGVKAVHVPAGPEYRVDVDAMKAAITDQTILLVGSAPAYPQGVVDPITDIARLAADRGLLCHVDACVGGFMLPWVRKLGYPVPDFDFAVPGVTSMSADVHKYGFAAKGASVVLYRSRELRRYQYVTYADWPGGLYGSPTAAGTRPGGPMAAAWAVLQYLGEEGYLRIAKQSMQTAHAVMAGVRSIPELHVLGEPTMSIFAFGSSEVDVYALADAMDKKGWSVDRQQKPPSLHMSITPAHAPHVEAITEDLRSCVAGVRGSSAANEGSAAMYGMLGSLPDRSQVEAFISQVMDSLDATTA
jgi:glutamate/tyrosine decarboxylase-like PLP-dependent enzyme